jgi:AraC-like DNA-binding protein
MSSLKQLLLELLEQTGSPAKQGFIQLGIDGVWFFWAREKIEREPLVYEPGIIVLGQGHKVGFLGDREFIYDPGTCLVVGAPIPFECESHATPKEPLLGIRIDLDLPLLYALVAKIGHQLHGEHGSLNAPQSAVEPTQMSEEMRGAVVRLLECARDPIDSAILGPSLVTEVIYRVVRSEKGRVLYGLTQHNTQYASIANALVRIHRDYRETLSVDDLARESAMSTSSFHRAFKSVTGDTPLQYLKKIRLDKARGLLMHQNVQVNAAAYEVGYESPSQFSREFKRLFDISPSEVRPD